MSSRDAQKECWNFWQIRKAKPPLPHPHLQIRQCRPYVALGALGNLTGDGDRDAPSFREECRENLVFRGLELD